MSHITEIPTTMSTFAAIYPTTDIWLIRSSPWYFLLPANGVCPICSEYTSDPTVETMCGHKFHAPCLMRWFQTLGGNTNSIGYECTCPLCRRVLCIAYIIPVGVGEDPYPEEHEDYSEAEVILVEPVEEGNPHGPLRVTTRPENNEEREQRLAREHAFELERAEQQHMIRTLEEEAAERRASALAAEAHQEQECLIDTLRETAERHASAITMEAQREEREHSNQTPAREHQEKWSIEAWVSKMEAKLELEYLEAEQEEEHLIGTQEDVAIHAADVDSSPQGGYWW